MSRLIAFAILFFCMVSLQGCAENSSPENSAVEEKSITLATTTSTQDSGLLDMLLPEFRSRTGVEVKVVAVGSGQALEIGRRGDADVLLTHAPSAEEQFVAEGFAAERIQVFHNDFVLVGPRDSVGPRDRAQQSETSVQAEPDSTLEGTLRRIAAENLVFVSRGDDSGTHRKELELWKAVSIEPTFPNYLKAGTGMAQTLRIAAEKRGYTLADRATFLATRSELGLEIISEGDARLVNPYSVMLIDSVKHPHVRMEVARQFVAFLQDARTQRMIADFGREKYGEALFFVE